jgi:hypothetical protein
MQAGPSLPQAGVTEAFLPVLVFNQHSHREQCLCHTFIDTAPDGWGVISGVTCAVDFSRILLANRADRCATTAHGPLRSYPWPPAISRLLNVLSEICSRCAELQRAPGTSRRWNARAAGTSSKCCWKNPSRGCRQKPLQPGEAGPKIQTVIGSCLALLPQPHRVLQQISQICTGVLPCPVSIRHNNESTAQEPYRSSGNRPADHAGKRL